MKEETKIPCKVCEKDKIQSFLDKEKWGINKNQHYRLTCNVCGFNAEINEGFLKILEGGGK